MDKIIIGGVLGVLVGFAAANISSSLFEVKNDTNDIEMGSMSMVGHEHVQVEVDNNNPLPKIEIEVTKDKKSGFNVKINTENYQFTPQAANEENVANTGHAHVYVNDMKISRVYGEWFYLADKEFMEGENEVLVTLNANDHAEWTKDGVSIEDSVIVIK